MATPRPHGTVPFTMIDLLLHGHPGELLPDDLRRAEAAAQWFIADDKQPDSARQRVLEVWIEGIYAPRWDPKAPSPAQTVAAEGSD